MADNHDFLEPTGSAPTGTDIRTVRAIEIGGVLYPVAILRHPTTGAALVGQATQSNSLPVTLSTTDAQALADIITALSSVSGTVTANLGTIGNVATQATLVDILNALASVAVTGSFLTDAQLRATALSVSGTITANLGTIADVATQATLASVLSELQATLDVALTPDARSTELASIEITLSGTSGTVTSVTIPDYAKGFRLYPRANAIRFAIGEDPAAVGASSSTTIAAAAFGVGGIAKADLWETRLIGAGTSRTVRLRSTTASVVIDMEVF